MTFFLLAPTHNFQNLEKSAYSRDNKANETRGQPNQLSTDISALCPLQDPWKAYLPPRRAINQSTAP